MMRRFPWLRLVLAALCLGPIGCETHRPWLRPKDDDDVKARSFDARASDPDSSKVIGGDSDGKNPTSFFKDTRRSGGWSSEAREIEKDLGAY